MHHSGQKPLRGGALQQRGIPDVATHRSRARTQQRGIPEIATHRSRAKPTRLPDVSRNGAKLRTPILPYDIDASLSEIHDIAPAGWLTPARQSSKTSHHRPCRSAQPGCNPGNCGLSSRRHSHDGRPWPWHRRCARQSRFGRSRKPRPPA